MSDFASLLSSFKQNAASAATAPPANKPSESSSARKKRPLPPPSNAAPDLSFLHSQLAKNSSFELSFLVIGGQKCGTTWVHTNLQKCKQITLPTDHKEVHFWDWHYRKGMDWYIRQFSHKHNHHTTTKYLLGEITPDYVVLSPSTISEIHHCFPNLKIVFIARDLVDRAWSAMIMELRDQTLGLNPGEFAEGVIEGEKQDSKRAKSTVSIAHEWRMQQLSSPSSQPDSYFLERLQSATHDSRSDYAKSLKNWYEHFPQQSMLLIDYREIESNPREVLFKIVTHVGVEEGVARRFVDGLEETEVRRRVNAAAGSGGKDSKKDLSNAISKRALLMQRMQKHLSPYAVKFNALLKDKGYKWSLNEYQEK